MSESSPPNNTPPTRTGSVRAGRDLKAENVVAGVQVLGADAETARAIIELARQLESGSVEAVRDIIAKNVVTGLQYVGQGGTAPNLEQFRQELTALREQLDQAVKAGEIADTYDAEDAQKAVGRAIEQSQEQKPAADKITPQLEQVTKIIDRAATAAESAGKFQAAVIKLAPVAMTLYRLASWIF